jgi:hypothetical protein
MQADLNSLLIQLEITKLEDLRQIAYNERIDTKYFFSFKLLPWLISEIKEHYKILKVEDSIVQPYKTVYYDTSNLKLYLDHHNGKLNRYKLRKRFYFANNLTYTEIKFKSNKGITYKKRISSDNNLDVLTPEDRMFFELNSDLKGVDLYPQATNFFNRITLISKYIDERITLDFNLKLQRKGKIADLGNLVIAEIKKSISSGETVIERKLIELGIRSSSFSKYCTAIAMIEDQTKNNNFKIRIKEYMKINEDF